MSNQDENSPRQPHAAKRTLPLILSPYHILNRAVAQPQPLNSSYAASHSSFKFANHPSPPPRARKREPGQATAATQYFTLEGSTTCLLPSGQKVDSRTHSRRSPCNLSRSDFSNPIQACQSTDARFTTAFPAILQTCHCMTMQPHITTALP